MGLLEGTIPKHFWGMWMQMEPQTSWRCCNTTTGSL